MLVDADSTGPHGLADVVTFTAPGDVADKMGDVSVLARRWVLALQLCARKLVGLRFRVKTVCWYLWCAGVRVRGV